MEGVVDAQFEQIARLKREVNEWHRRYYHVKISLLDWESHEYDKDYDDEVASENMKEARDSYKPIYPEV